MIEGIWDYPSPPEDDPPGKGHRCGECANMHQIDNLDDGRMLCACDGYPYGRVYSLVRPSDRACDYGFDERGEGWA